MKMSNDLCNLIDGEVEFDDEDDDVFFDEEVGEGCRDKFLIDDFSEEEDDDDDEEEVRRVCFIFIMCLLFLVFVVNLFLMCLDLRRFYC